MLASIGFFANQIIAWGGVKRYEDMLWKALAFITRYGHQRIEDALDLDETDRLHYMKALGQLIAEENKSPTLSGG
jgi:hypothetical protein